MSEIKERQVKSVSGIPLLTVLLLLTVVAVFAFINLDMSKAMRIATIVIGLPVLLIAFPVFIWWSLINRLC